MQNFPAFIELKHAVKKYGEGDILVYALNETDLVLPQGEISVVLGPSGSGKSTLLNMVGGLDTLDSGELLIGGPQDLRARAECLDRVPPGGYRLCVSIL